MRPQGRNLLSAYLELHGFSQSAFARMAGLDPSAINKLVNGVRQRPDLQTALAIEVATAKAVPASSWIVGAPKRRLKVAAGNETTMPSVIPQSVCETDEVVK